MKDQTTAPPQQPPHKKMIDKVGAVQRLFVVQKPLKPEGQNSDVELHCNHSEQYDEFEGSRNEDEEVEWAEGNEDECENLVLLILKSRRLKEEIAIRNVQLIP